MTNYIPLHEVNIIIMEKRNIVWNIRKDAARVLGRVIIFLAYYFLLIILGLVLIGLVVFGTIKVFPYILHTFTFSVRLGIIASCIVLTIWGFALSLAFFLIRPLFVRATRNDAHRVEIHRADAPELFEMIADIARRTGNKMPLHVYLTPEVNACVFYNTATIMSVFFPPRKNLNIGVGLLCAMNVDELKAILAHEFGHFSQQSMRIGTISYRLLLIVNDIITQMREEVGNDMITTVKRGITSSIVSRYNAMEKVNRSLSRYMEFEADGVACRIVGVKAFTSALCKLSWLERRYNTFSQVLTDVLQQHFVEHYLQAYHVVYRLLADDEPVTVDSKTLLSEPLSDDVLFPSRITIINGWNTHPTLRERLDNVAQIHSDTTEVCLTSAETLIPEEVIDRVGQRHQQLIVTNAEPNTHKTLTALSDDDFELWAAKALREHHLPYFLAPFTYHESNPFPVLNDDDPTLPEEPWPFTEEYRRLVVEYNQAVADMNLLKGIDSGEYDVEEMLYDGEYYTSAEEPLTIHEEYLAQLQAAVTTLDRSIYLYLLQHKVDRKQLNSYCTAAAFAATHLNKYSELYHKLHNTIEGLRYHKAKNRNVEVNPDVLDDITYELKTFVSSLDLRLINTFCGNWPWEDGRTTEEHLVEWHNFTQPGSNDNVFKIGEHVWRLLTGMYSSGKNNYIGMVVKTFRQQAPETQSAATPEQSPA